ncbi:hypothetical protein C8R46DRAFT_1110030 [Mycena filopes]|nr:hypothetical protein C8R46DRAFT_1110030 [Mycena filopes]
MSAGISGDEKLRIGDTRGHIIELDPSTTPKNAIVIMDGSVPFVTTAEEMEKAIPDRGPLVRACGACHKTPGSMGVKELSSCGSCGMTRYCSRECQRCVLPICVQLEGAQSDLQRTRRVGGSTSKGEGGCALGRQAILHTLDDPGLVQKSECGHRACRFPHPRRL